jgi:hypothetical protein
MLICTFGANSMTRGEGIIDLEEDSMILSSIPFD